MFKPKESSQNECEFVFIDELIPDDHLLRIIDNYIDFTFVLEKKSTRIIAMTMVVLLILLKFLKMMFIGYFFGIRSERQLEKEIRSNIAYRWFLALKLKDSFLTVPCQNMKKIATHLFKLEKVCCHSLG